MKYKITYELTTANGFPVVHAYIGDKAQIIEAIKIARANKYRIISVQHYTEGAAN